MRKNWAHVERRMTNRASRATTNWALPLFLFLLLASSGTGEIRLMQKPDKHIGSIKGRVVDEAGRPLANGVPNVRPAGGRSGEEREAATDDTGEFVVDHLQAKAYTIHCEASGYLEADSLGSYYLIGETVTLKMTKGGVITGRVTSDSGEPYVKARVAAVRVLDENGQPLSLSEGADTADTDDRGIYRIYGLESGHYLVSVERAGLYGDSRLINAASIYYPSVTHDGAQQIAVTTGQEAGGIDITYRSVTGHVVGGTFSGMLHAESKDQAYIKLIGARPATVLQEGSQQDRSFLFYGVADGDYYLVAENDSETPTAASQPYHLTVKGADVRGIDLRLVPFASASGRVTIERTPVAKSNPECKETRAGLIQEA